MGIPLDSIFCIPIFLSVTVPSSVRYPNQNTLWYDEKTFYLILWKQGKFCESKLLWAYNSLKANFVRFSRFCESRSKVDRNWLKTSYQVVWSSQIFLTGLKVLWARFFYVSTPFLLVVAAAAAAAVGVTKKLLRWR